MRHLKSQRIAIDLQRFLDVIHGNADEQVPYEQSPKMCDAMRKAGAKCEVVTIEGGRHGMMSWEKEPSMAHWKADMVAWLKKTLAK